MILTESQVGYCPPDENLDYPGINSCLTVTAVFPDGARTGAHLVRVDEEHPWDEVFNTWLALTRNVIGERGIRPTSVVMAGATDFWPEDILENIRGDIAAHLHIQHPRQENLEGNLRIRADGAVEHLA